MVSQLARMAQRVWDEHRHICENFLPHKDTAECTGCRFYHRGALPAFPLELLIENGLYNASRL